MADYDFRGLSPIDFEALVRDLLSAETGLRFETFAIGPDGGIDCRNITDNGTTIAQCKHRPDATRAQMVASAKNERKKLTASTSDEPQLNLTDYYFVMTAALSPAAVVEVAKALGPLIESEAQVWTRGRLNSALATHQHVERRHFKLWLQSSEVLARIIGSDEWHRNEALIQDIQEKVAVYVHTPKYSEALDVMQSERVVIISGAPGVGKSTLAEMILVSYWEKGWKLINLVSDIADAWKHMRDHPDEKVIFYYDDFLGQTSQLELQKNEGSDLERLIRALRRSKNDNALLVMTTRAQILNKAINGQDEHIRRALADQEPIRVELSEITRNTRARMLFNHLYSANFGTEMLDELSINSRYLSVIDHHGFNPRLLESVRLLKKPTSADGLYDALLEAMEHPETLWAASFGQLSEIAVRLLLNLAIEPRRRIPVSFLGDLAITEDPRSFGDALTVLEDTWIRIESTEDGTYVRLYDPSRRDFLLDQLDDFHMFRTAIENALSLRQIEHVLKYRYRPLIGNNIEALSDYIDQVGVRLFERSLALGAEYLHMIQVMATAANAVHILPELYTLKKSLRVSLKSLDFEPPWHAWVAATTLFELATNLDSLPDEWAGLYAEQCVVYGADYIADTDELRSYAELSDDLRGRIDDDRLDPAIYRAFNAELDAISELDDRETMEEWLREVEDIATQVGASISTDSTWEKVESASETTGEGVSSVRPSLRASVGIEDTDAAIAKLFSRLAH